MTSTMTKRQLKKLSPDNCFVAIAKTVGPEFQKCPEFSGGDDFERLRRLIIGMMNTGKIRDSSIEICDPPINQSSGANGMILARFWLDCIWDNWREIHFRCKVLDGSPQGNLPYTIVISIADIKEPIVAPTLSL